ncbi:PhoH family protein [Neptuniibacter sp. QD37_11]|uniref:PhoH family protein n=1 Tax=Neptuniibacter sp. QD37_11 TaxID=3398209 RepID=UPI0039F4FA2E
MDKTRKQFILDTNVLLSDPFAFKNFEEHRVVIPMTVLEELDSIKDRKKSVAKEARIVINQLEKIFQGHTSEKIYSGVPLGDPSDPKVGTVCIFPDDTKLTDQYGSNTLPLTSPDNRILSSAIYLQNASKAQQDEMGSVEGIETILVTKDINMRLKALASGIEKVEGYQKEKILDDIRLLKTGFYESEGDFWSLYQDMEVKNDKGRSVLPIVDAFEPYPGQILLAKSEDGNEGNFAAVVESVADREYTIQQIGLNKLKLTKCMNLNSRNIGQAMALYQMKHRDNDIVALTGQAGTGKTLMALAYAIEQVSEKKASQIIITRALPPLGEDIGFLPGSEEEKMGPWLAAFEDNLEVIRRHNPQWKEKTQEEVRNDLGIMYKSINFMRGRSFNDAIIILDEAQNLSPFQMKTLVSRVGHNSKMILTGNLGQIDDPYLNPLTSGLTHVSEKLAMCNFAGIVNLQGIERSRLAAFAEKHL